MAGDRVVLIDGSALIFRAFFAIPSNLSTATGLPTNAIYGFALMFRKIMAGRTPKYGAVVFDAPGGTFRDERYPEYKSHRPRMPRDLSTQIPWIHQLVEAHDFPMLSVPGFEADDVIGTLTKAALAAGHEVRIVSGDKDFAQLIGPEVRMIDTMRDITYDEELVRKKWGVPPSQFVDLLAILGDKVDNIPGVAGVGQKSAAKLLDQYGDLEAILAAAETITGRAGTALREQADVARMSQELATIDCAVPLPLALADLEIPPIDKARVESLYRDLEFYSLLDDDVARHDETIEGADFAVVGSIADLRKVLATAGRQAPIGIFVLFELPSPFPGPLVGVALAPTEERARWIPLGEAGGSLGAEGLALVTQWLEDPTASKLVHHVRDTWTRLARIGVGLEGVAGDPALSSFLIDPTGLTPHHLGQIAKQYLHRTLPPIKTVLGSGQSQRCFADVAADELCGWIGLRVAAITEVWPLLVRRVDEEGHTALLAVHELPLSRVLARMQQWGIRADKGVLDRLGVEFEARKAEIEAEIYALAGHEFNIGSTKQLAQVLFEELGLPVIKRTKTGYSTDAEVLDRLAPQAPIAALIVRQRALAKLINTYTRVLSEAIDPFDGRIHATFQQTVGASGRLISTDPDLQRTPIRTEDGKRIREAFLPAEGWVLISADWSQIELRVLAHMSEDPVLIEAFETGIDVHRRTASTLFDCEPDQVTPEQRNVGKTINFATIYGQGATALGQQLGIPRKEAKAYIDRYFERYAGVRTWVERTVQEAYTHGYVTTLLGRRRYVSELSSNNFTTKAYGERIAANTPIQGTAADLCKQAMLDLDRRFREEGLQTRMLLQIHDELIFEAPPDEVDRAVATVRDCMEHVAELRVPLVVDVGTGASWAEAKG